MGYGNNEPAPFIQYALQFTIIHSFPLITSAVHLKRGRMLWPLLFCVCVWSNHTGWIDCSIWYSIHVWTASFVEFEIWFEFEFNYSRTKKKCHNFSFCIALNAVKWILSISVSQNQWVSPSHCSFLCRHFVALLCMSNDHRNYDCTPNHTHSFFTFLIIFVYDK